MGARVLIALGLLAATTGCASLGALDRRLATRAEKPPQALAEGECLWRAYEEDGTLTERREAIGKTISTLTQGRKKGRPAFEFAECRVTGRTYVFTAAGVVSISPTR